VQDSGDVRAFLHNHLRFRILYNLNPLTDLARIVGFEVEPFSVKHRYEGSLSPDPDARPATLATCNPNRMISVSHDDEPQLVQEGEEVIFSYDVLFEARPALSSSYY
jgi:transmembrane 9 superfamily member 2/4